METRDAVTEDEESEMAAGMTRAVIVKEEEGGRGAAL